MMVPPNDFTHVSSKIALTQWKSLLKYTLIVIHEVINRKEISAMGFIGWFPRGTFSSLCKAILSRAQPSIPTWKAELEARRKAKSWWIFERLLFSPGNENSNILSFARSQAKMGEERKKSLAGEKKSLTKKCRRRQKKVSRLVKSNMVDVSHLWTPPSGWNFLGIFAPRIEKESFEFLIK